MSVFNRSVADISTDDLRELLTERLVENVRLEFKSTVPSRDEFLKKASGFANTYGGLLVIGASAPSSDGKLDGLPGVSPEPGLKQKLVQWAFERLGPPLEIFVSEPIPTPIDSARVCYVLSIPESVVAPHFINGRKGAYVRTDEFSGRFEAQLATYEEISHLADRRALSVTRRTNLLARSEKRLLDLERGKGGLEASLSCFFGPAYPHSTLVAQDELVSSLEKSEGRWRSGVFPNLGEVVSQHESLLVLNPSGGFSLLEATTWGSLFYSATVAEGVKGIQLHRLVGVLLVWLWHAARYYSTIGIDGLLWVRPSLKRIRNLPLLAGVERSGGTGSPIDDSVEFELLVSTDQLRSSPDSIGVDILRILFFALNWHELTASDPKLIPLMNVGYEYNFWTTRRF